MDKTDKVRECKFDEDTREGVSGCLAVWGSMKGELSGVLSHIFGLPAPALGTVVNATKKLIKQSHTLARSGVKRNCWHLSKSLLEVASPEIGEHVLVPEGAPASAWMATAVDLPILSGLLIIMELELFAAFASVHAHLAAHPALTNLVLRVDNMAVGFALVKGRTSSPRSCKTAAHSHHTC